MTIGILLPVVKNIAKQQHQLRTSGLSENLIIRLRNTTLSRPSRHQTFFVRILTNLSCSSLKYLMKKP